jgi:hypothetical protein
MAQAKEQLTTTRRAVIQTAAGLTAAVALRATIAAPATTESDPLLALHDAFRLQERVVRADDTVDEARFAEKVDNLSEIEWQIIETPATTAAGALAKIDIFEREHGEHIDDERGPDIVQALALSVIADCRRFLATISST